MISRKRRRSRSGIRDCLMASRSRCAGWLRAATSESTLGKTRRPPRPKPSVTPVSTESPNELTSPARRASELVEHFFRHETGRLHGALIRLLGVHNLALAEDV